MAYRTILVHFTGSKRSDALLQAASVVAKKNKSHVIGLYVVPPVEVYMAFEVPIGAEIIDAQKDALRADAKPIEEEFEKTMAAEGISAEWRTVDSWGVTVADVVQSHGRCCDLIIAGQDSFDKDTPGMQKVAEDAMFGSGRPVLFVPAVGTYETIGDYPTVAWDGGREAARAASDALPFLKSAKKVNILSINPEGTELRGANLPGTELATMLSRHGVVCEVNQSITKDLSVDDEILSRAADYGSDMLVMGGFGHSRLREFVLGGATRGVLKQMTVPVLMSH